MPERSLLNGRVEEGPPPDSLRLLDTAAGTLGALDAELERLLLDARQERMRAEVLLCTVPLSLRHVRGLAREPVKREPSFSVAGAPWPLATTPAPVAPWRRLQFHPPRVLELVRHAVAALAPTLPRPRSASTRRKGRALPIGLICAGSALSADAVVTVLWQEPLTALYAAHQQHVLSGQFTHLQRVFAESPLASPPAERARLAALSQQLEHSSHAGQALGRIESHRIGMRFVVVQGTDTTSLEKGPGHYRGTALPGTPGVTAIAGHRTTFLSPFRRVAELHAGDAIDVTMPYGRFSYRVLGERVVSPTDVSVLSRAAGSTGSRLVLTTCDPLYSAARRRVVIARLVSATPVGGRPIRA